MAPIFGGSESSNGKRPRLPLIVIVVIMGILLGFTLRALGVF